MMVDAECSYNTVVYEFFVQEYDDAIKDCHSTLQLNPFHFGALSGKFLYAFLSEGFNLRVKTVSTANCRVPYDYTNHSRNIALQVWVCAMLLGENLSQHYFGLRKPCLYIQDCIWYAA